MIKKNINQNDILNIELLKSLNLGFTFNKSPINRYKTKENVQLSLTDLKNTIDAIQDCELKKNATQMVFGSGTTKSKLMIIGGAPGEKEDQKGKPFVGDDGSLLDKMLNAIDIKRENIYLTYAVNYRPPHDRKPTTSEIKKYNIFLQKHISIINPKLIILMGSTAMEAITGLKNKISDERGKWKEIIIKNKSYKIMITFDPSYLLRFPENKKYSWQDLKKINKFNKNI
ncbi:uracil-DNA glycosylase [Candidatus Pelagibacter sp.]|nr:uracil-DNA glycosylase [Candidatus Pelagibacter sp.]